MMNQVLLHVLYTTHVTHVFSIIIRLKICGDGTNKRKEWRQDDYNVKYLAQAYTVLQTLADYFWEMENDEKVGAIDW